MRGWTVVILLNLVIFGTEGSPNTRHRRDVLDFGRMIKGLTGVHGMNFLDYGNYCGYGGSSLPRDSIDACCLEHDQCYHHMRLTGNCKIFTTKYTWTADQSGIICGDSPLEYCAKGMCECDRLTARCFANNLNQFTHLHQNFLGTIVNDIRRIFQKLF